MESGRDDRIIVLIDMDCFYVQVEQKFAPEYLNKPCAVVQYNTWKGGGIIAVNYEARAKGVNRHGRGDDAIKKCPDIHLFRVPEVRGKADLTRYREAGAAVMEVLCKFCDCVERASIDEAYLDLTNVVKSKMENDLHVSANQIPNTFVAGWKDTEEDSDAVNNWLQVIYEEEHLFNDRMLAVAALLVEEMRAAVLKETGYKCSGGIAHNKMLAKLSCGLHKPNKQTVTPQASIPHLYQSIPVNKVRNLGGKLGEQVMEKFNAKMMEDLLKLPKSNFVNNFGEKTGNWLFNLSRGIENEPVVPRQLPKSIGCGKNFPGKSSLDTKEKVHHWVKLLARELEERLLKDQENNQRIARLLTVNVRNSTTPGYSTISRSCPIVLYSSEKMAQDAFAALQKFNTTPTSASWTPPLLSLAMAASKFQDKIYNTSCDIQSYFNNATSPLKKRTALPDASSSDIDLVVQLMNTDASHATENSKTELQGAPAPGNSKNHQQTNNVSSALNIRKSHVSSASSAQPKRDISSFFGDAAHCQGQNFSESRDVKKCDQLKKGISRFFTAGESSKTEDSRVPASSACSGQPEKDMSSFRNLPSHSVDVEDFNECGDSKKYYPESGICLNASEPSTSNANVLLHETVGANAVLQSEGMSPKSNPTETVSGSVSNYATTNSNDSTAIGHCKPAVAMGFFARKLQEKARLEQDRLNCENRDSGVASAGMASHALDSDAFSILPSDVELDSELTNLCSKCNRRIPVWEEEEHADYHVALDLSKSFANDASRQNLPSQNSGKSSLPVKGRQTGRKRGNMSKSSAKSKKPFQQNTLDSFLR